MATSDLRELILSARHRIANAKQDPVAAIHRDEFLEMIRAARSHLAAIRGMTDAELLEYVEDIFDGSLVVAGLIPDPKAARRSRVHSQGLARNHGACGRASPSQGRDDEPHSLRQLRAGRDVRAPVRRRQAEARRLKNARKIPPSALQFSRTAPPSGFGSWTEMSAEPGTQVETDGAPTRSVVWLFRFVW
jgi:hypothetical protein